MCSCSGNCNCNSATIPRGPQGIPGPQGDDGNAATISVGSVNTGSPAAVTNSGTQNAAIFDFIIPQGDPGSVWYNGAVAPTTLYNDGDYYINTSNGYYYEQQSGAWVFIGNLTGPAGLNGTFLVYSTGNSAPTTTTGFWVTLYTATINGSDLCENNLDIGKVTSSVLAYQTNNTSLAGLGVSSTAKFIFEINGVDVANTQGVYLQQPIIEIDETANSRSYANLQLDIIRLTSTSANYIVKCIGNGSNVPTTVVYEPTNTITIDFTTTVTIKLKVFLTQNSPAANVFTQGKMFYIEKLKN